MPAGYIEKGLPYYGKTPTAKPIPLGVTSGGNRFYKPKDPVPIDSSNDITNTFAGFDSQGFAIFVQKGLILPQPTGYTTDGIAYYDVAALMKQRGAIFFPRWKALDEPREVLSTSRKTIEGNAGDGNVASWRRYAIDPFYHSTAEDLIEAFEKDISRKKNSFLLSRKRQGKILSLMDKPATIGSTVAKRYDLPPNPLEFLRSAADVVASRQGSVKFIWDPPSLEFQSLNAFVSRPVLLKHRSPRADKDVRDFYLCTEPADVFSINFYHLAISGEGVTEITVNYSPSNMAADKEEGSLFLIDSFGRHITSCKIIAQRKAYTKVSPSSVDLGWVMLGGRKSSKLRIENSSSALVSVDLKIGEDSVDPKLPKTSSSFSLPIRGFRLQPNEAKFVVVNFEPTALGHQSDSLTVSSSGGDFVRIPLSANAGMPISFHPETEEDSAAGVDAIARERCELMSKMSKLEKGAPIKLSQKESAIADKLLKAFRGEGDNKKYQCDLDLGIIEVKSGEGYRRLLTIMNVSDSVVVLGLHSGDGALKTPKLQRIAPKTANTICIELDLDQFIGYAGEYQSKLDVLCPDFQNFSIPVHAFIGQPIVAPCFDLAFVKPCRIYSKETLKMVLFNISQYPVDIFLISDDKQADAEKTQFETIRSYFTCSLSSDQNAPTRIGPYSMCNFEFNFHSKIRGPYMERFMLGMANPSKKVFPFCAFGKPLNLIGICIEPQAKVTSDDKNHMDYLRDWLSHPKKVVDDYSSHESIQFSNAVDETFDEIMGTTFKSDIIHLRPNKAGAQDGDDFGVRPVYTQSVVLQNNGHKNEELRFFSSTSLNVEPFRKEVLPARTETVDFAYTPSLNVHEIITFFGFVSAIQERTHMINAIQVQGKHRPVDFYVFPMSEALQKAYLIDFGVIDKGVSAVVEATRNLVLFNGSTSSVLWDVRLVDNKNNFMAFESNVVSGELKPMESFLMPIKYRAENVGSFEVAADIFVKDMYDKYAKAIKFGKAIFRASCVQTSVSGIPDSIDFENIVVGYTTETTFVLKNVGTTVCTVSLVAKAPVIVSPRNFVLGKDTTQEVKVSFSPTESLVLNTILNVFVNDQVFSVSVIGTSGAASLVCDSAAADSLDLGVHKESSLLWTDIYLTNKGSLPLNLAAITSDLPGVLRMEFIDVVAAVKGDSVASKHPVHVRHDSWAIVKRKQSSIVSLKSVMFRGRKHAFIESEAPLPYSARVSHGTPVQVLGEMDDIWSSKNLVDLLPVLSPLLSYQLRIGFSCTYGRRRPVTLQFHYVPVIASADDADRRKYCQCLYLDLKSTVYRFPEIFPPFYDFGLVPLRDHLDLNQSTEETIGEKSLGITRVSQFFNNTDTLQLALTNPSLETQNVALDYLTSHWFIQDRSWQLGPGEKIFVAVEFRPTKEQKQYNGEAEFSHNYGRTTIYLSGTGAKADVTHEVSAISFGRLQINTVLTKMFSFSNRGLLGSLYQATIEPSGAEYSFAEDEMHYVDGFIPSGTSMVFNIKCHCFKPEPTPASLILRWQIVSRGTWQESRIPLSVSVGNPRFRLKEPECDFQVTFLTTRRKCELIANNDGNAHCKWKATVESPWLSIEPSEGVLQPGTAIALQITYAPMQFELFRSRVLFNTEAGDKVAVCYGIVGIPYLKIKEEELNPAFGVIQVNRKHSKSLMLVNQGKRVIQYEVSFASMTKNGLPAGAEDFGELFLENASGGIASGGSAEVIIHAYPTEFKVEYKAEIVVSTRDGEKYTGTVSCIGGQAIIRFEKPPFREGYGELTDLPSEASHGGSAAVKLTLRSLALSVAQILSYLKTHGEDSTVGDKSEEKAKSFIVEQTSLLLPSISQSSIDVDNESEAIQTLIGLLDDLRLKVNETIQSVEQAPDTADALEPSLAAVLRDDIVVKIAQIIEQMDQVISQENSEILSTTVRVLSEEKLTLDGILHPESAMAVEPRHHRNFHMGLLRGGDLSPIYELFVMKNVGNLSCEFQIRTRVDFSVHPEEFDPNESDVPLFDLQPIHGTLDSEEFKVISSSFMARVTGFYQQGYAIDGGDKTLLSFSTSVNIGNPLIEVVDTTLDFGTVLKKRTAAKTFEVRNAGTYRDNISIIPHVARETDPEAIVTGETQSFFTMGAYQELLLPGDVTLVPFTFEPTLDGPFSRIYKILWSKEPIYFTVQVRSPS